MACPIATNTIKMIGGKWKLIILLELLDMTTLRFNELHRLISGISQRMLTRQLRELENDGLVVRKIYPVVPPKVEYSLTVDGEKLKNVFEALHHWSVNRKKSTDILQALKIS